MKNFDTDVRPLLDACESEAQKLSIVTDDIFEANLIPLEEQIPVFWGIVQKNNRTKTTLYTIGNLKTLAGTIVKKNPYNTQELNVYMGTILRKTINENDEVCVIVRAGPLNAPHEILNIQTVLSIANINCSENDTYLTRINYLIARPEFLSLKGAMENLLTMRGLETEAKSTLEILKEQIEIKSSTLETLNKELENIAPQGIEAFNYELKENQELARRLEADIIAMQEEIRKARFFASNPAKKTNDMIVIDDNSMDFIRFQKRLDYVYNESIVIPFLMALSTNQIIILYGPPGTGKTTLVSKLSKALGAKNTIVSVQSSWTDSADLLGYYSPIDKTYEGTRFVEALIEANREWLEKGENSRLHIICLDEMNLARVEYYFATFLSLMQLSEDDSWIRLLPAYIEDELDELATEDSPKEGINPVLKKGDLPADKQYLGRLRKYHAFRLPPNVRFVGTINNDDTTNELSPKVRDRSIFISLDSVESTEDRKLVINDYYPVSFFETVPDQSVQLPAIFRDENKRFISYSKKMLEWIKEHMPEYTDENDQISNQIYTYLVITKILPILRRKDEFKYYEFSEAKALFNERADNTPGEYFDLLGGY